MFLGWVQFLSKLFARSFSIASVNVYSANPVDHLVHKFTHRVVRGTLLAVGRPDGRLNGLTAAENAASLAGSSMFPGRALKGP
jgi:hypothetical protein